MTSCSSPSGSLTCRGPDSRTSGHSCGPVLHRGVGSSSSTTARPPTSRGLLRHPTRLRIWSSAACTTEGSSRSSRSSTSRRSCSHFWVTKVGRQGSMQRAGSSSGTPYPADVAPCHEPTALHHLPPASRTATRLASIRDEFHQRAVRVAEVHAGPRPSPALPPAPGCLPEVRDASAITGPFEAEIAVPRLHRQARHLTGGRRPLRAR